MSNCSRKYRKKISNNRSRKKLYFKGGGGEYTTTFFDPRDMTRIEIAGHKLVGRKNVLDKFGFNKEDPMGLARAQALDNAAYWGAEAMANHEWMNERVDE